MAFAINASAFSLSYSGGSVGGSTGATGSTSGYTVHQSNAADNVVGYRFSIYDSNGNKKSGTYTSNCFWDGYENYQKFVLDVGGIASKRDIANGYTISTTSGKQSHDYTIGEAGFSSVPPQNPGYMSGWIQDGSSGYANLKAAYSHCGKFSFSNDDYLLIEPIVNMKLAGVETVATPTELAMYGANVSGGTQYNGSNGNLYNAGSSSLWNLQHYVNREFPNLLFVADDTPFYLSVPNLIGIYTSPSRYSYKQIIDNGLGCSVLKVSNVIPINYTMTYVPQGGVLNGSTANCSSSLPANSNVWYPAPTRDGYTWDGWYDSPSGGNFCGGGCTYYVITHDTTLYAHWTLNLTDKSALNIDTAGGTYSENLLKSITDQAWSQQSSYGTVASYSISNSVVTVTAENNDGYVYTTLNVSLTAGVEYSFSCDTNGIWGGNGADTVEAYIYNWGSEIHRLSSNQGCTFIADGTGSYCLRLDVNAAGKTYNFSNIKIIENNNLVTNFCTSGNSDGWYGNRAYYSVADTSGAGLNSGVVTVTSRVDDGYVYSSGCVFLTAGVTYTFSCNTNAPWGDNVANTVEVYLMNGALSHYYWMSGNTCTFTAALTGKYYLRLDVNTAWQTYSFWNIKIVPTTNYSYISKGSENQTYALKAPTRAGYTFNGWTYTNIISNVPDCGESAPGGDNYAKYYVSNGSIVATRTGVYNYVHTMCGAYLIAGQTYTFSCNTNATWRSAGPMTDGYASAYLYCGNQTSTGSNAYIAMQSNNNYMFTVAVSGMYYIRFDVDTYNVPTSFWNVKITQNSFKTDGTITGVNTYTFAKSAGYLTAQWTVAPSVDLTVSFVEPNSNYRAGTTVISTFMVKCTGAGAVYPKDNLTMKLSGSYVNSNNQTVSLTQTEKNYIVIPGNGNNIVYFKWNVPDNCKNILLTAALNPNNTVMETNYSNNNCTVNKSILQTANSSTPDTTFQKQKPSDWFYIDPETAFIDVSSITNVSVPTASWSEWIYDEIENKFIKKTYSSTLESNQYIKPDSNTEKFATKLSDTKWQVQSGYGFEYNGSTIINTNAPADSITLPQNGNMYLPDYKYSNALGKYCTLDCLGCGLFQLQKSQYSLVGNAVRDYRRVQFTELWFPDKDYSVDTYLYDSWTPAGMISQRTSVNSIAIKGSMYDNWYISHTK